MRVVAQLILVLAIWFGASPVAVAASGRIIKVLPQFLDLKGRHTLSPSLYDRDAYQAHLRTHPEERSGLRIAVQWKSTVPGQYKLRLELRGRHEKDSTTVIRESSERKRGLFSNWTYLLLEGGESTRPLAT